MAKREFGFTESTIRAISATRFCVSCGMDCILIQGPHCDHAIAHKHGQRAAAHGIDLSDAVNAQPLCPACNGRKGKKSILYANETTTQASVLAAWAQEMRIRLTIKTPAAAKPLPPAYVKAQLAAQRAAAREMEECGE